MFSFKPQCLLTCSWWNCHGYIDLYCSDLQHASAASVAGHRRSSNGQLTLVSSDVNGASASFSAVTGTSGIAEVSYSGTTGYATYEVVNSDPNVPGIGVHQRIRGVPIGHRAESAGAWREHG